MPKWILILLTASMTFLGTEFYLHNKVVMTLWGQLRGCQLAMDEKEEELAARRIQLADMQKQRNTWIFESNRLKDKLERYEWKIKQSSIQKTSLEE